jgi:hypothetical protein
MPLANWDEHLVDVEPFGSRTNIGALGSLIPGGGTGRTVPGLRRRGLGRELRALGRWARSGQLKGLAR